MIILGDFLTLNTDGFEDVSSMRIFSSLSDALSGKIISTQSQFVRTRRRYNVLLDIDTAKRLRQFVATTRPPFNLIDHEGFAWLTATGTDDTSHAYSTGAYFEAGTEISERPQAGSGYYCNNLWKAQLTLVVNARGWNGNSVSSGDDVTMYSEIPSGTINGVNAVFTLTQVPLTLILIRNGLTQIQGTSFNLSGNTITFTAGNIPQAGDSIAAFYTL